MGRIFLDLTCFYLFDTIVNVSERREKMDSTNEVLFRDKNIKEKLVIEKGSVSVEKASLAGIKIVPRIKTEEEIKQEKLEKARIVEYSKFFRETMEDADIDHAQAAKSINEPIKIKPFPQKNMLEIANDNYVTATDYFDRQDMPGNCSLRIVTLDGLMHLLENPMELQKIDLVHAVMPFDDAWPLINAFKMTAANKTTRVVLGAYGPADDIDADWSKHVLSVLMSELDFCEYAEKEKDGNHFQLVHSTYHEKLSKK
jgi:hypothetical protein